MAVRLSNISMPVDFIVVRMSSDHALVIFGKEFALFVEIPKCLVEQCYVEKQSLMLDVPRTYDFLIHEYYLF